MNLASLLRQLEPMILDASQNGVHKSKSEILGLLASYKAQYDDFARFVHFNETG